MKITYALTTNGWVVSEYSLANTSATSNQQEEKANNMTTETQAAQRHLTDRAYEVWYKLNAKLNGQFNRFVNNAPKTYKELIDAIKNDKFKLDEKRIKKIDAMMADGDDDEDDCFYSSMTDGIIWDGPQFDRKAYAAAVEELGKKYTATLDIIKVLSPADGLKALNELEAWVPSNLPS